MSEDFDSDPDIFISKRTEQPKTQSESEWYCLKKGSDTCIIRRSEINRADTFFIGVRCRHQCRYSLRAMYVEVKQLQEGERTQYRLQGHSSNIFEYYIPSDSNEGFTNAIQLSVQSESNYSPIETYLSLDEDLYQIEERSNDMLQDKGKVFRFASDDYEWCINCYVYLLVDVIDEGRYYITGEALARDIVLDVDRTREEFVPAGRQQCLIYYVEQRENDLKVTSQQFQGEAEVYISSRQQPNNIEDSRVRMISDRAPHRSMIISSKDRSNYQAVTGQYLICLYAYTDTSTRISVQEQNFNKRFFTENDVLYTANIPSKDFIYFSYTSEALKSKNQFIVTVTTQNLDSASDLKVYFKVCNSNVQDQCYLEKDEGEGKSSSMSEIGTSEDNVKTGLIFHNPKECNDPANCFYLITVYNRNEDQQQTVSIQINYQDLPKTQVQIGDAYRNIKKQGSYEYYELQPDSTEGHPFADAIIFTLRTYNGDADLFVSTDNEFPSISNYTFKSTEFHNTYEKVIVNRTTHESINKPIYVAVHTNQESAFELRINAHYHPTLNERLVLATPLKDSQGVFHYWLDEFQESFFSFRPWWSGTENRTMVFLADMIFNKIIFYASENDYPRHFSNDYLSHENIIAIEPNDPHYDLDSEYYIRIRPDFAMQDLISKRQYIFTFFAFSQLPEFEWQDLQLGQSQMGYSNSSRMFYRHYMISEEDTYVIKVEPMIGNPTLMVSVNDEPVYAHTTDSGSYHFISNTDEYGEILSISFEQRIGRNVNCETAGYARDGGNKECALYVTVQCQTQCAYNITIETESSDNDDQPGYLIDHIFQDGSVEQSKIDYFYYPINNETGDIAIFLNKTGPIDENGDTLLIANLITDTTKPLSEWNKPTLSSYEIISVSNSVRQPEIIDICGETLATRCENSCALYVGVMGRSSSSRHSYYRIQAFSEYNKLFDKEPKSGIIENARDYHYFWFISNATVEDYTAEWQYVIATGVEEDGKDVDLYVSGLDGRIPNKFDSDWYSDNVGPDDVYITDKDTFFSARNYNTSNGILFVVAIQSLNENTNYSIMMAGPKKYQVNAIELKAGEKKEEQIEMNSHQMHTYKWFNWGHNDFTIRLVALRGDIQMLVNNMEEEAFTYNAYLAVPLNKHNAREVKLIEETDEQRYRVYRSDKDSGDFCYYCWYYVTIYPKDANKDAEYELEISNMQNEDLEVPEVQLDNPSSITLSGTGSASQRKFILDTKEPFSIKFDISRGNLQVYVGLFSTQPSSRYIWREDSGVGEIKINVRTTDQEFKLGAYYFITMQSTDGRTEFSVEVSQDKKIAQLANQVSMKDLYWVQSERVKLYFFQVPKSLFIAKFTVRALSEDFYPQVYLYKNERNSRPEDFRTLTYPTFNMYTHKLGTDFIDLVQNYTHEFMFEDEGQTDHTFFTIALYSYSNGLTDRRKAEFELSLEILKGHQISVKPEETIPFSQDDSLFLDENTQERTQSKETFNDKLKKWFQDCQDSIKSVIDVTLRKLEFIM